MLHKVYLVMISIIQSDKLLTELCEGTQVQEGNGNCCDQSSDRPVSVSAGLWYGFVCLFVGCLASQQQASVFQGRICSDNFTCCHTEIEVADQTFYLTQSQYTDTGPTSPSADPLSPGA